MAKNDEKTRSVWIEERNGRNGMQPIDHGPYCRVRGYICKVEFDLHSDRAPFLTQYVPLKEVVGYLEEVAADFDPGSGEPESAMHEAAAHLAKTVRLRFEPK